MPRKRLEKLYLLASLALLLSLSLTNVSIAKRKALDFGAVVKLIESHYRVKSKGLPFVAKMGIKVAQPFTRLGGYGNIKIAMFEDQDFSSNAGSTEFSSKIKSALQPEWQPLVEVHSDKSKEQTYIYTKEIGDRFKLLVITIGRRDGTAVQVDLSEKKMAQLLKDPEKMGRTVTDEATSESEQE